MSNILIGEATVKLVLEALEQLDGIDTETECVTIDVGDAITALREALAQQPAQQEQEPVYHLRQFGDVTKDQLDRYIETGNINPQPAQQELVARTDKQIVDQTEELAVWLLGWRFNHHPETSTLMRESPHPFAGRCWAAACHIQEMLTATDPENAVAELEGEAAEEAAHGIKENT